VAAKIAKLEAEKKKKRKRNRKTSPPLVVEMPVIPTPSTREVESNDEEEDEATDDPQVIKEWTVRWSLSPAAKRQQQMEQKTTEDDPRQGLEAQRAAATAAQARMPMLVKARTFRPKLRVPTTARYGLETEGLLVDYLLLRTLSRCFPQVGCGASA
jgi:hypothetical protein